MRDRFLVTVTFDERRGYIASHPELPVITALSLSMLRLRIEERLIGEDVEVKLALDRTARLERDQRRRGDESRASDGWPHAPFAAAPALHSITSSARASTEDGISSPSALAVLRLMVSSYLVDACTGRSAGLSPLRMRST
jgi:hypothetical protein